MGVTEIPIINVKDGPFFRDHLLLLVCAVFSGFDICIDDIIRSKVVLGVALQAFRIGRVSHLCLGATIAYTV